MFDKVAAMNGDYYDLRGKIVSKERRISALTERLEMWAQYQKYKPSSRFLNGSLCLIFFQHLAIRHHFPIHH